MIKVTFLHALACVFLFQAALALPASSREDILQLADQLVQQADNLAQSTFDRFRGWKNEIADREQAVLFKSEAFAASCRLFLRLSAEHSGFSGTDNLRTNLFNAYTFLVRSFRELEQDFRSVSVNECRQTLNDLERTFMRWPASDNLAYLHQKFIQANDRTVYLIELRRPSEYQRRPFSSLESLFRYNYLQKRSRDPWKYKVQVDRTTLEKMDFGPTITLTFDGCLVMDMIEYVNRPVFLIENGKKRPLTSPAALNRFGGWKAVFEVPAEVLQSYPEGSPLQ
ncbi:MAG: hypothetical protein JXI33_00720 [Candidatus Aminicenantes bacterium]|nr:hypothetical protein [Candidatus Aminicenantes bacterium]